MIVFFLHGAYWLWPNLQLIWLRTIELHGVTLAHSPLQNFFNILTFKQSLEEARGPLTADKLAELYDKHVKFANPDDAATWLWWGFIIWLFTQAQVSLNWLICIIQGIAVIHWHCLHNGQQSSLLATPGYDLGFILIPALTIWSLLASSGSDLPRCCVTQNLLSCSWRQMKVTGKLSATGANIKSWFKRAGQWKESGGSFLQCLLPTKNDIS